MSIDDIKNMLPDVQVSFGGVALLGILCGRNDDVATVYVPARENASFQFSWPTIRRAINDNRTLRL